MKRYIGLSGWARSGKDTTAEIMVRNYGFTAIAFADVLRDFLYAQNAPVRMDGQNEYWTVKEVIDAYGWQGYKTSPFAGNMRHLIQYTGTEAGRQKVSDTVWIDATIKRAKAADRVVFPDVRFFNEAFAVQGLGGEIWRIDRPGTEPTTDHASERELDDYPFNIRLQNDSTLEELSKQVEHFLVD